MSRIDRPVLRCDRCGVTTEDLDDMAAWSQIYYTDAGGRTYQADLCTGCWLGLRDIFHRKGVL